MPSGQVKQVKRVAIVGCGQLAQMLALAGLPLGLKFSFLVDTGEGTDITCVDGLGDIVYWKPGLVGEALYEALKKPDVVTFEKEQVDLTPIKTLSPFVSLSPSIKAVETCQNRHNEKQFLESQNVVSARYRFADSEDAFKEALKDFSGKVVIKSITDGYDGKAQWRMEASGDVSTVPQDALQKGVIIEEWVPFVKEVSVIAVRNEQGEIKTYAPTENTHDSGILVRSIAPAKNLTDKTVQQLEDFISRIMNGLSYVGVLGMECFVKDDGVVLVNELAPRVHNSGHWTQDGAVFSQFENHVRAISGLSLGATDIHGVAGMVNVLGPHDAPRNSLCESSTLHWYGKSIKPGRKLGHVNFVADSMHELEEKIQALLQNLG